MKEMFYYYVTTITEWLTGLDHTSLKLWEVEQYVLTSSNVTTFLNVSCLVCWAIMGLFTYAWYVDMKELKN